MNLLKERAPHTNNSQGLITVSQTRLNTLMKKEPSLKENNETFGMGAMGLSFGYQNPVAHPAQQSLSQSEFGNGTDRATTG